MEKQFSFGYLGLVVAGIILFHVELFLLLGIPKSFSVLFFSILFSPFILFLGPFSYALDFEKFWFFGTLMALGFLTLFVYCTILEGKQSYRFNYWMGFWGFYFIISLAVLNFYIMGL